MTSLTCDIRNWLACVRGCPNQTGDDDAEIFCSWTDAEGDDDADANESYIIASDFSFIVLIDSRGIDDGVGEEETDGKIATKRTNVVLIIKNCEKKECEPFEKGRTRLYKNDLTETWFAIL